MPFAYSISFLLQIILKIVFGSISYQKEFFSSPVLWCTLSLRNSDLYSSYPEAIVFHICILGVAVLEGPMYAVGGHDGWSYLNTVERWDPQARQWNFVASMSTPRSTVGVAILNGKYVKEFLVLNLKSHFNLRTIL